LILKITLGIGILFNLTELMCYISYFHYIFKHESTVAVNIVKPSDLKQRRNRNAFSMAGQIAGWLMNVWPVLLVAVLSTFFESSNVRDIMPFFKMIEFVLLPLIQMYTSPPIRRYLKEK